MAIPYIGYLYHHALDRLCQFVYTEAEDAPERLRSPQIPMILIPSDLIYNLLDGMDGSGRIVRPLEQVLEQILYGIRGCDHLNV